MNIEVLSLGSLVIVLLYILVRSADLIEDAFVYLARRVKVSEFFIGFVILSLISSLPEFSIALSSNDELPELSIGNLFGATLILITFVVGTFVIRYGDVEFKGKFGRLEIFEGLMVIGLSVLIMLDAKLSTIDGIIMILSYIVYVVHIYFRYRKKVVIQEAKESYVNIYLMIKMLAEAVVGIILILVASSLLVDTIVHIGDMVSLNESFVGVFVLAIGTNVPELTILVRAKKKSQQKLAIGNILGSATVNTLILGILAVLSQGVDLSTHQEAQNFIVLVPVLMLLSLAIISFMYFSYTDKKLTRSEAIILVGFYISLICTQLVTLL